MVTSYAIILAMLIVAALVIRWCFSLNKQSTEVSDMLAEIEHKEWLSKRRANMTQKQRDSEDDYINGLRAMPVNESWKPRTGNSLSKDLLGFDLLPK